jgi:hypothetical protein
MELSAGDHLVCCLTANTASWKREWSPSTVVANELPANSCTTSGGSGTEAWRTDRRPRIREPTR